MFEELVKYFDFTALIMVTLLTSFAIGVINQTQGGKLIHNGWLALGLSTFFTVLFINWGVFKAEWQTTLIQFFIIMLPSTIIAITRGQDAIDKFINWAMDKANINKDKPNP